MYKLHLHGQIVMAKMTGKGYNSQGNFVLAFAPWAEEQVSRNIGWKIDFACVFDAENRKSKRLLESLQVETFRGFVDDRIERENDGTVGLKTWQIPNCIPGSRFVPVTKWRNT
jgi:hypothetical protein